jgi:tyrosine-protein phosphatase YwqE
LGTPLNALILLLLFLPMFSFFFRNKIHHKNALQFIGADMHNHILPGIDDGSPDIAVSLQLTEGLMELGYHSMVCTPHIIPDLYPNNELTISHAFRLFSEAKPADAMPGGVVFAAEYLVDYDFERRLKLNELLIFGKQRYILIEMSYLVESPNLKEMIFELIINGFQPILAHPERYHFYHHRMEIYEELLDAGCMLQVNLLSLTGYYGAKIKSVSEKLISKGMISWVGTDMHHLGHLEGLKRLASDKKILQTLKNIKNLKNPEHKLLEFI